MTITWTDQRTIINEADATTSWTGTVTINTFTSSPTPVESTTCLGMNVSNTTEDAYLTVSSTDFTAGNSPGPSVIYFWIFHRAELDTTANGGIAIQLGDGTNRVGFHVAGSDVDGFRHAAGPVGWQSVCIDTANLPASTTTFAGSAASLNLAAITQIGVAFKTLVKAVGNVENCFWDISRRGAIGQGFRITGGTGGSPGLFTEIATADRATGNQQAYGVFRRLGEGLYGLQAPIYFGDDSGSSAHVFRGTNETMVFEARGFDTDKYTFVVQGNSTGAGEFSLTNCAIVVPSTDSADFDASDTDMDDVNLINTQIVGFDLGVSFSSDATNAPNHEITGCTFRDCGQIGLGRVPTVDSIVTGYLGTAGAVLWNANIDIQDCQFNDNTNGTNAPAIEHTAAGTFGYDNLTFSGNDYDINNSSNATTADSYSESNQDATQALGNGTITGVGQSFTNASAGKLSSCRFYLSKTGSPTGNIVAKLYALASAIGGGDDVPTGTALATSDNFDASTLTGSLALVLFNFGDNFSMSASTDYFIALETTGGYSGDGSNLVNVGVDTSSPSHSGNMATTSGTWSASSGTDVCFYVSRDGYVIIQAANGANPSTYINTGSPPGGVRIENGVTITITVVDQDQVVVPDARVYVQLSAGPFNDDDEILRSVTNGSGVASTTYNFTGEVSVVVRVRKRGYEPQEQTQTIKASGLALTVTLPLDPRQE